MTMSNERLLNETCLAIARDMLSIVSNLVMEHERRDAFTEFYEAARQRLIRYEIERERLLRRIYGDRRN